MAQAEQAILDFFTYPPVGDDDWRYAFQTAQVRIYEMGLLSRATLLDMANADSLERAADLLSGTEYALQAGRDFALVEQVLQARRTAVRTLFVELMLDRAVVELFRAQDDFANLRLAVRRMLTGKSLGKDYSEDGNLSAEVFEEVFAQESTKVLPAHIQQAVDQAVLGYYQDKDIRRVDYAIDAVQAEYNLNRARKLGSVFLSGLFKIQIDLTNIRTMLRLKLTGAEQRNVFLEGGYVALERFRTALDLGYEALGPLFFVTPYHRIVEAGAAYVASSKSFLRVEQQCDEHLAGFLKTTGQIITGPQPIIAYLLMKENEIRTVRLILTAKKNSLDTKLILDRIA